MSPLVRELAFETFNQKQDTEDGALVRRKERDALPTHLEPSNVRARRKPRDPSVQFPHYR